MNKKKVFIVTDKFLYSNGYTKHITDKLDELGIKHTTFYDVAPDPSLASATEGAEAMRSLRAGLYHSSRRWFSNGRR